MPTNATIKVKSKGRPPLSPNGLDRELRTKQLKKSKKKSSRLRVEMRKRQQEKLRRKRRKRLRKQRLKEPLGQTVRKRYKAVRYYQHWRERYTAHEAALRAAQKHQVSGLPGGICLAEPQELKGVHPADRQQCDLQDIKPQGRQGDLFILPLEGDKENGSQKSDAEGRKNVQKDAGPQQTGIGRNLEHGRAHIFRHKPG